MADSALVQKTYTAVLEHFKINGRAPHFTELAADLGVAPEEARLLLHEAADSAVACWFMADSDYVESWPPFSNIPTQYLVTIDGDQKWYGQ